MKSYIPWLDVAGAVLTIAELVLIGAVIVIHREWAGIRSGSCLNSTKQRLAYVLSFLLLVCAIGNIGVTVGLLLYKPENVGIKDELPITAFALGLLWWTDFICVSKSSRRRRKVAELLACVPTFRVGKAGHNSPTSGTFKETEFVIRSALQDLQVEATRDYWRGKVARVFESHDVLQGAGRSIVVLYDATTQDEAGAELLTPCFTHATKVDNTKMVTVIWRTLLRSKMWLIAESFQSKICSTLGKVTAVRGMQQGELWYNVSIIDKDFPRIENNPMTRDFCSTLWAVIAVEMLDFLRTEKPLIVLQALVDIPLEVTSAAWDASRFVEACEAFASARTPNASGASRGTTYV